MRLLGFWRESPPTCLGFPDPGALVDPSWEPDRRGAIAAYLDAGQTRASYAGFSTCRIAGCTDPARDRLGTRDLSDGTWVWPEGLAHYVRDHAVRLPDEFVATMTKRAAAGGDEVDRSFWLRWSAEHTPPPPATPDACSLDDASAICAELATRRWRATIALELGRWKLDIAGDVDWTGPISARALRGFLLRSRRADDDAILSPPRMAAIAVELEAKGRTARAFARNTGPDGRPWWAVVVAAAPRPTRPLDDLDLRRVPLPAPGEATFLPGGWKVEVVPAMDELAWRAYVLGEHGA